MSLLDAIAFDSGSAAFRQGHHDGWDRAYNKPVFRRQYRTEQEAIDYSAGVDAGKADAMLEQSRDAARAAKGGV